MTLLSGICEGGPLGGLPLHHGEPRYHVARSKLSRRIRIRNLPEANEEYEVGHYDFDFELKRWDWTSPIRTLDETDPLV